MKTKRYIGYSYDHVPVAEFVQRHNVFGKRSYLFIRQGTQLFPVTSIARNLSSVEDMKYNKKGHFVITHFLQPITSESDNIDKIGFLFAGEKTKAHKKKCVVPQRIHYIKEVSKFDDEHNELKYTAKAGLGTVKLIRSNGIIQSKLYIIDEGVSPEKEVEITKILLNDGAIYLTKSKGVIDTAFTQNNFTIFFNRNGKEISIKLTSKPVLVDSFYDEFTSSYAETNLAIISSQEIEKALKKKEEIYVTYDYNENAHYFIWSNKLLFYVDRETGKKHLITRQGKSNFKIEDSTFKGSPSYGPVLLAPGYCVFYNDTGKKDIMIGPFEFMARKTDKIEDIWFESFKEAAGI